MQKLIEKRQECQQIIPSYYNPYIFFGLTNIFGITAIYYCSTWLKNVQPLEWLTIPAVFMFANFFEYFIHKGPMHNRRAIMDILFQRHTLMHHEYFREDQMGFDAAREAYMVLFPFWAIVLFFALASPVFFITWYLSNSNIASFFLIVAVSYYLLYEWLHLSYHLPKDSKLGNFPIICALREHHQAHHDKKLMNSHNFNITFPIWDWIMGTVFNKESN